MEELVQKILLLYGNRADMSDAEVVDQLYTAGDVADVMSEIIESISDATKRLEEDMGTDMASVWQKQINALSWAGNLLIAETGLNSW